MKKQHTNWENMAAFPFLAYSHFVNSSKEEKSSEKKEEEVALFPSWYLGYTFKSVK